MDIHASISEIKGIGAKTEELFHNLGVYTIGDILLHFPRDYHRYPAVSAVTDAMEGDHAALSVKIVTVPVVKHTGRFQITVAKAEECGIPLEFVWFRMPYLKNTLKPGMRFIFYGRLIRKGKGLGMEQPKIFSPEEYQKLEENLRPLYPLTKGLTNNLISKTVEKILTDGSLHLEEIYTPEFLERNGLVDEQSAIREIHFPSKEEALILARKRIVFDEFFFFILSMQFLKEHGEKRRNQFSFADDHYMEGLLLKLPYELTGAQARTLREIITDMNSPYVMQRLIQGDVGSGKTIVAFLLMAVCSHNGYQSAIMAPTEVLARQHYETFTEYLALFGIEIPLILLTGSLTAKEKRNAYDRMELEENAIIIGTHALIQEKAVYRSLALVVTDEQHRFGVKQRETLAGKGKTPHILVMSATPIPRTLAIILYGDLDISVIDELPAKRLPIKNCVVGRAYRPKAYAFIADQVKAGHQAYVICPLVEESEEVDAENVTDYTEKLKKSLPADIQVGCLHGKMTPGEKNRIMEEFLQNRIQVLVSTTVIEVGVNVPNATVMMVENAERFGLAQLHQLRGRVGRGDAQSYCIFVNGNEKNPKNKRLEILNKSNDGFFIASEDLKLRGPGDFFGIRQSGILDFKMADVYQDADVLQLASKECTEMLETDSDLTAAEHEKIRKRLDGYMRQQIEKLNL